ncbi:MAG: hypothetical protein ACRD8O_15750 [Bryobacteraceae bacterium]
MMFGLKALSPEAVPAAVSKAERYRLLNEPWQAESICQDVLNVDPDNQHALVILLLALTDQFDDHTHIEEAKRLIPRLREEYDRSYYSGIICERRAKTALTHPHHGSEAVAYAWLRDAMQWYEKAEAVRPPANDDALLRWNTCARLLMRNPHLQPSAEPDAEPIMSE